MELNQVYLYRITHILNIPHILKYGITHRLSSNRNVNFVPIGDGSLINYRNKKVINIKGGSIYLGNYIPFYFGVRMPMLYVIQHGYNYTQPTLPEDIVYVAVHLKKIIDNPLFEFYFTDGHAIDNLTTFYNKDDIDKLVDILDWDAITIRKWGSGDIKRRKQAEFLVNSDVPIEYVHGYVCYNEKGKSTLLKFGVSEKLIKVVPQAYY